MINGCWLNVPDCIDESKLSDTIEKVKEWCDSKKFNPTEQLKIIGTLTSLIYMIKLKKECYQMWSLIFKKGIKWLNSIETNVNWNQLIQFYS